jgi:hypothetical protein
VREGWGWGFEVSRLAFGQETLGEADARGFGGWFLEECS